MVNSSWEDMISLNSRGEVTDEVLDAPIAYLNLNSGNVEWDKSRIPLDLALDSDKAPLPTTSQREGYYGDNHFDYWASGLRDYCQLLDWMDANQVPRHTLLDLGCATGRFIRHADSQSYTGFTEVIGCDINRTHVDWVSRHLSSSIKIFQNTSIPSLPLPDASVDVVTAFSVFTHIECFDATWLMELRRILRPGGIAWLTVHGERTWRDIDATWPLYNALTTHPEYKASERLPGERVIFRWHAERSYSSNVFYSQDYLHRVWGRILTIRDFFPALPFYQDVVVLQKS